MADAYLPSEMAAAILAIPGGGTDTSDATAAADEILAGKTAYVNGVKITGTATFVPTGTVIYYAGKAAPSGYLACDGTVYNIADYPELAAFFAENYEANNYWGGDGETTFAVPDWQGEFFRAAGTQSRENQGSGAGVGVHQNGTEYPYIGFQEDLNSLIAHYNNKTTESYNSPSYIDRSIGERDRIAHAKASSVFPVEDKFLTRYTSRPTNTSLLVCIKT